MRIAAMAASMGGNVRVGLEDLAVGGSRQTCNVERPSRSGWFRSIIEGMGLEIATADEAREIFR